MVCLMLTMQTIERGGGGGERETERDNTQINMELLLVTEKE